VAKVDLNWAKIREEFENTPATLQQLAEKYNVSPGTVRSRKSREGWEKGRQRDKEPKESNSPKIATQRNEATQPQKSVATKKKESEKSEPHAPNICGARTRQGTMCKNPAGFRTPHFGTGRCFLHGGLSTGGKGGPPGNKKGLKTGAYEAIWLDVLPEEEQQLYHEVITDKVAQLDQEIRLLDIRERRMLQRIEKLKQADFTVVEQIDADGMEKGKRTNLYTEKRAATLGQIQAIEEALTKVQARKERLLDLKHKFEQSQGLEKPDVGAYIEALRGAAKEAWQDEKGDH
jgi:uncharacterized protein YjcR